MELLEVLFKLDVQMAQRGWWYVRYMDDVLIMAPTRWKLRRAVKTHEHMFYCIKITTTFQ